MISNVNQTPHHLLELPVFLHRSLAVEAVDFGFWKTPHPVGTKVAVFQILLRRLASELTKRVFNSTVTDRMRNAGKFNLMEIEVLNKKKG